MLDANDVRVMDTLIPAAKHKHANCTGIPGMIEVRALPKAAPAAKKGKMKPPRYPPATVAEMATILQTPTRKAFHPVSISNPMRPEVGQMCSRSAAGLMVAMVWNSASPQNMVCGMSIPRMTTTEPPMRARQTASELSRSPKCPSTPITLKCSAEKQAATPAPSNPIKAPVITSRGPADASLGSAISQMDWMGNLLRPRNTTRQTSPQNIASTVCSKYSTPNLELTSNAKSDPPNGLPKNAARAPAIPISVCFRTTLRFLCLKTRRETKPPRAAQMATRGASGPSDPPPRMENMDAATMGTT
mmetsp:Transcript_8215/g.17177  ORF Transcript_8215/g.17177 Transcript_8215/m.17177 type:complete len:302 (+) Transcript_8215:403-1308(+)